MLSQLNLNARSIRALSRKVLRIIKRQESDRILTVYLLEADFPEGPLESWLTQGNKPTTAQMAATGQAQTQSALFPMRARDMAELNVRTALVFYLVSKVVGKKYNSSRAKCKLIQLGKKIMPWGKSLSLLYTHSIATCFSTSLKGKNE